MADHFFSEPITTFDGDHDEYITDNNGVDVKIKKMIVITFCYECPKCKALLSKEYDLGKQCIFCEECDYSGCVK